MPPDKLILRTQANEVFAILSQVNLDASEFEWQQTKSTWAHNGQVSQLVHRPTGYYFTFDHSDQGHWAEYSPADEKPVHVAHPGSWNLQRAEVQTWAGALKREVDAPDLWGALVAGRQLVEGDASVRDDNRPFEQSELQRIDASLSTGYAGSRRASCTIAAFALGRRARSRSS